MEITPSINSLWCIWIDVTLNVMRTVRGRYFEYGAEPQAQD